MDTHSPDEIKKHVRFYLMVFGALLALTVVTVWVSKIEFGHTMHLVVGLGIAALKAGLVAAFFMHLMHEAKLIYRLLVFTIIFFIALMLLSLFALKDEVKPVVWHSKGRIEYVA